MGLQKKTTEKHTTPFNEVDRIIISSQLKIDVVNVMGLNSDARM